MAEFNVERPKCVKPELECRYRISGKCCHVEFDGGDCPLAIAWNNEVVPLIMIRQEVKRDTEQEFRSSR